MRTPSAARGLAEEIVVLALVAVVVLVAMWPRTDLAAHLVAGGGCVFLVVGLAPEHLGRWTGVTAVGGTVVAATVVEVLSNGLVDLVDVSFSGAGAVLVVGPAQALVPVVVRPRGWSVAAGVAMVVVGVVLRYGG